MAERSFVDELRKQLNCPSCGKILTIPKTLRCLHTICLGCITKDQKSGLNNNNVGYICPECNIETTLPEGSAAKLQSSSYTDALLYLLNAIEALGNEKHEEPINCYCCKRLSFNLTAFCAECSGLICSQCVSLHNTKKHKNHNAVLLQYFTEDNLDSYIKSQTFCQETRFHGKNASAKRIYYFCKEDGCQLCICRRCCLLEHQKHRLLSLDEMVPKFEKKIQDDMVKLQHLLEKLEEDLEDSQKQMTRVDQEIKVAKQKVRNAVETVIKKAREHEEAVIESLEERLQDYRNANYKEQNDIKERKKQLEGFTSRCRNMIDRNKWELVRIQKNLKLFCKTFVEMPPVASKEVNRNLTVHYVTDYVICQSVKSMGKIVESVTDQSHCPIESLKEPRYSFVNNLDYVTRSSDGDMSMATRWKRTFLWSRSKSMLSLNEKPLKNRAYSVS